MAKYLIKPIHRDGWVFCNKNFSKKDIKDMLINSQMFVSDLDYTLTNSPTAAFTKRNFFKNIKTIRWGLEFFFKYLLKNKGTEQFIWNKYFETFNKDLKKIRYKEKDILKSIYPGVRDFFLTLKKESPAQQKILITRTAPEILLPYKDILGFEQVYHQEAEKGNRLKNLVQNIKKISLAGDSEEDEKMLEEVKNCNIDYCLGIYVAKSPQKINERFYINIGRNWKGLARILEE